LHHLDIIIFTTFFIFLFNIFLKYMSELAHFRIFL
jgi:hypothetical protein